MNMISWILTPFFESKPKAQKLLNELNEHHPACHYWISTMNVFDGSLYRKQTICGACACACVYERCLGVVKAKALITN